MSKRNEPSKTSGEDAVRRLQQVSWETRNLKTSYANVCNVSSTREELVLQFGVSQPRTDAEGGLAVDLGQRVILSPFAAKRLALLLENVLAQYEQRFGPLEVGAPRPAAPVEPAPTPVQDTALAS